RAVEAPRRVVAGAQLQMDARHAGDARRLEQPIEHALADADARARRETREPPRCRARTAATAAGLEQPVEHALADAEAPVRRTHREQHEMRALVAELHDGEARDRRALGAFRAFAG